ncbi:lipoprotein [Stenotrophomonas terrae]|uniref:Lipoprotein n=1 Tax=Stenotrophomonas terrae TaxID=405446 RepID=A0A0R0CDD7_9GAMM|nr:lipoprotein [Stenotrophomonas terrae]
MLVGCSSMPSAPAGPVADVARADIARRIPTRVDDRAGWAADIQTALAAQQLPANPENICAVLAVIEQESGYRANPEVPDLPRIARGEIDRRAAALHVPKLLVDTGLKMKASDGRSYGERLARVRSERDLSELYEEIIGRVPMGQRLFAGKNPVQTGGAMQVGIAFAQANAQDYPYPVTRSIRDEVFTRRGGVYFGTAHLLGYQTPYTQKVHRFADYNAGRYASRNAAFQAAVARLTGTPLALDGDLLVPDAPIDKPGQTERAVRSLAPQLGLDERAIRRALAQSDSLEFSDSPLHSQVFALADARAGTTLPRAVIPGIRLDSPKITRELTTEWFANRVDTRYRQCLQR